MMLKLCNWSAVHLVCRTTREDLDRSTTVCYTTNVHTFLIYASMNISIASSCVFAPCFIFDDSLRHYNRARVRTKMSRPTRVFAVSARSVTKSLRLVSVTNGHVLHANHLSVVLLNMRLIHITFLTDSWEKSKRPESKKTESRPFWEQPRSDVSLIFSSRIPNICLSLELPASLL